jgi:hypothetical protein
MTDSICQTAAKSGQPSFAQEKRSMNGSDGHPRGAQYGKRFPRHGMKSDRWGNFTRSSALLVTGSPILLCPGNVSKFWLMPVLVCIFVAACRPATLRGCEMPVDEFRLRLELANSPYFPNGVPGPGRVMRVESYGCGYRIDIGNDSANEFGGSTIIVDANGKILQIVDGIRECGVQLILRSTWLPGSDHFG